ncbi:MAG: N-acetyltransferase family protein [Bacteroidota bacterium]
MRAVIEPVTLDRLPSLLPLWRESMNHHAAVVPFFHPHPRGEDAWYKNTAVMLAVGDGMIIVARSDGEAVGFIYGQIQAHSPVFLPGRLGYISDLYVKPECRRHGLGRLLFLALRDWFAARGVETLDLQAYLASAGASAFWRRMGFEVYAEKMRLEID